MILSVIATLVLLQTPKASIEGTVLSSTTNKPIAGAQLTAIKTQVPPGSPLTSGVSGGIVGVLGGVRPGSTLSAGTDENGRFVFQDLEPGTYIVNATADGYARQQVGVSPYGK